MRQHMRRQLAILNRHKLPPSPQAEVAKTILSPCKSKQEIVDVHHTGFGNYRITMADGTIACYCTRHNSFSVTEFGRTRFASPEQFASEFGHHFSQKDVEDFAAERKAISIENKRKALEKAAEKAAKAGTLPVTV